MLARDAYTCYIKGDLALPEILNDFSVIYDMCEGDILKPMMY